MAGSTPSLFTFLCMNTRASTVSGVSEARSLFTTRPEVENVLSEGVEEAGTAKCFLARAAKCGKQ